MLDYAYVYHNNNMQRILLRAAVDSYIGQLAVSLEGKGEGGARGGRDINSHMYNVYKVSMKFYDCVVDYSWRARAWGLRDLLDTRIPDIISAITPLYKVSM
jgi:hypothetical protein